jgi:GT2 family glycosyltransferase
MAPLYAEGKSPAAVEGISGACVMLKREVFEQAGLFEEAYFMYAEDMDLCRQVERAGFRNYFVPGAAVIHHGGGSSQTAPSSFAVVMMRQSIWKFLRKSHGALYAQGYRLVMGASALVRLTMLAITRLFGSGVGRGAVAKWRAVLRWSLYLERWAERYGAASSSPPPKTKAVPALPEAAGDKA